MSWRAVSRTMAVAALLLLASCGGGTVGSIGVILGREPETGAVFVRGVPEGNAGDRAGLETGDEIIFVDGKDVRGLDVAGLRRLLRGDPGSHVQLTVLRGERVIRLDVERAALLTPIPRAPPRAQQGEERVEEP